MVLSLINFLLLIVFHFQEIPLGIWEFRSKTSQDLCSVEGGCRGYMFALEVTEELETWPEQKNHARQWVGATNKSLKELHNPYRTIT